MKIVELPEGVAVGRHPRGGLLIAGSDMGLNERLAARLGDVLLPVVALEETARPWLLLDTPQGVKGEG